MNPCPVLVGRHSELATLRSILDAGGGFALVSGEAGIGKSRLIREFALEAEKSGRVVAWGRPEQVEQPGPFALVVDLLEALAERSAAKVAGDARALATELLRPAEDGRATPTARQTAAEIRGLLARLDAPPMVVLEDLHAADEASHAVVLHLARSGADDGHVIVGTLRPEAAAASPSLSRLLDELRRERIGSDLTLSTFGHEETGVMLEAMWGRAATDAELAALERLGEGVPFFIEELAASGADDALRVPKSLEQSIVTRMRGLGPQAGLVLSSASLMVGALDPAVLAHAGDMPVAEVLRHLAEAAKAGLVADDEGKLVFRHALVRDSIAASIVSAEAGRLHGQLAHAIETVHADGLDLHSTVLALHHQLAGNQESAVTYLLRSGSRALALAATEEARSAFTLASELSGGTPDALQGLAEVALRDGEEGVAAELYRAAADGWLQRGARTEAAAALGRLAWALVREVHPAEVNRVLDDALALLANDQDSVDHARLLLQKGVMLAYQFGLQEEARPILEITVDVCTRIGNFALLSQAIDGLAHIAENEGGAGESLELGRRAVETAARSHDVEAIGRTHNNHALILATHGNPIEALAVLAEGRELFQRAYGRAAVGALDISHAWISRLMGHPKEVADLTARGQVAWRQGRGYLWILEVWSSLEFGDISRARATVTKAWHELGGPEARTRWLADPTNATPGSGQAAEAETLLTLADKDGEAAWSLAESIVAGGHQGGDRFDLGQSRVSLVRAGLLSGRLDETQGHLDALAELAEDHAYPFLLAASHELRGLMAKARNDIGQARIEFEQAISILQSCANASDRARCWRGLANVVLLADAANGQLALDHLRAGRELAFQAGAVVELNATEGALRALGARPRAGRPRGRASERGLSPREAEVVVLVAAGGSNSDIASQLFLSARTVQDHISNSLRKLGLSTRAGLASWAAKQGMV